MEKRGEPPASWPPHIPRLFECSHNSLDKPVGLHTWKDKHRRTHMLLCKTEKAFATGTDCNSCSGKITCLIPGERSSEQVVNPPQVQMQCTHLQHSFNKSWSTAPSFWSDCPNKSAHPALSPAKPNKQEESDHCTATSQESWIDEAKLEMAPFCLPVQTRIWLYERILGAEREKVWGLSLAEGVNKREAPPFPASSCDSTDLGYTIRLLASCRGLPVIVFAIERTSKQLCPMRNWIHT